MLPKKSSDEIDLTKEFDKLSKEFYRFKKLYCHKKTFKEALSKFMKQEPNIVRPFVEFGYIRIVLELRLRDGINL